MLRVTTSTPRQLVSFLANTDSLACATCLYYNFCDFPNAGTDIVLVADPINLTIRVYQDGSKIRLFRAGDTFEAGIAILEERPK